MKVNLCIAALAASLTATVASAQTQPPFGVGGVLCGKYLKAARTSDILYHEASNWLLGYVSGRAAAMKTEDGKAPMALTQQQVLKAAGDYCEANPASTLAVAANEWFATIAPAQQQAAEQPSGDRRWILDLNKSSKYKPLIDRH